MITVVFLVVLPVFLVIGAGYAAARLRLLSASAVDGLMVFSQGFALPCLLFRAIADLDLGAVFDPRLLLSFYLGAVTCFGLGILGARQLFHHAPTDSVAIGFGALFSNSVLLGLPIMERAYGAASLSPSFAIISIHTPFCYLLGTLAMEIARADDRGLIHTLTAVLRAMMRNALMLGLLLGFIVNISGLAVPGPARAALDMMANSALPVALFGLGGVLTRYALRASIAEAGMVAALSLILHPAIAYVLAHEVFSLPDGFVRSAVMTAAMAPGVNTYLFASLYGRGQAQAASIILLSTACSVLTVSGWLLMLGGVATH